MRVLTTPVVRVVQLLQVRTCLPSGHDSSIVAALVQPSAGLYKVPPSLQVSNLPPQILATVAKHGKYLQHTFARQRLPRFIHTGNPSCHSSQDCLPLSIILRKVRQRCFHSARAVAVWPHLCSLCMEQPFMESSKRCTYSDDNTWFSHAL